jgi:hypothetical protein
MLISLSASAKRRKSEKLSFHHWFSQHEDPLTTYSSMLRYLYIGKIWLIVEKVGLSLSMMSQSAREVGS